MKKRAVGLFERRSYVRCNRALTYADSAHKQAPLALPQIPKPFSYRSFSWCPTRSTSTWFFTLRTLPNIFLSVEIRMGT